MAWEVAISSLRPAKGSRSLLERRVFEIMTNTRILNDPITVNLDNEILDGNHRVEARKRRGLRTVLCDTSPDSEQRLRIDTP